MKKTLTILYKSLVRSVLDYGHVLILNITETRKKNQLIQNRARREILGCHYRISNENIRQDVKIEKMLDRHKQIIEKKML